MNYGGYHSFVETIPIFETFATPGKRFQVSVPIGEGARLYPRYLRILQTYAPGACETATKLLELERALRDRAAAEEKSPSVETRRIWDAPGEDDGNN